MKVTMYVKMITGRLPDAMYSTISFVHSLKFALVPFHYCKITELTEFKVPQVV